MFSFSEGRLSHFFLFEGGRFHLPGEDRLQSFREFTSRILKLQGVWVLLICKYRQVKGDRSKRVQV